MRARLWVCLIVLPFIAACSPKSEFAPDSAVAAVSYRDPGPAKLTLFTMVSNDTGSGAHTGLMINASQRVLFDPAGGFGHETLPERNDVIYGITPQIAEVYKKSHARDTHHVIVQEIEVPAYDAELALRIAQSVGPVPSAQCALSTSRLLSQLPSFQGQIRGTWFPVKLADQMKKVPGVKTDRYFEFDDPDWERAVRAALDAPA